MSASSANMNGAVAPVPTLRVSPDGAEDLIVRPVYDQTALISRNQRGFPFGLPSNLKEQIKAWRRLVPLWRSDNVLLEQLFKVSNLSDSMRRRLTLSPAYTTRLNHLDASREESIRAARCLALILITRKGYGDTGKLKEGQLAYNWKLCQVVFGPDFTKVYRKFVIEDIRSRSNGHGDRWT